MFRLLGQILLTATLAAASTLQRSHTVQQDAGSHIVESIEQGGHELPLEEEKAVPQSVLKKPTLTRKQSLSHSEEDNAVARSVLKKPSMPKKPPLSHLQERQKAHQEAEAAAKKEYTTQTRLTLKGIKYEAEEKEQAAHPFAQAPQLLPEEPPAEADHEQNAENEEHDEEHEEQEEQGEEEQEEEHEEEKSEEEDGIAHQNPNSWLVAGALAEWNPFAGKKAKHLLRERDWLVVTIVDKEHDEHGKIMYGIKKGGLRTAVGAEQLRKPVKHLKESERKEKDEAFWKAQNPTEKPSDGLEYVMVPVQAKVGATCKGQAQRLGTVGAGDKTGIDAEDCRQLCEQDASCNFASHGFFKLHGEDLVKPSMGCVKYESCDMTTGKGYRTWRKVRLDPDEAQQARNTEKLEDSYMSKIAEAEEITVQRLEEDVHAQAAARPAAQNDTQPAAQNNTSGQDIVVQQEVSKVDGQEAQNKRDAPFWRMFLEAGAVLVIIVMFWSRIRALKHQNSDQVFCIPAEREGKDANAFFKLRVWLQRESKPIVILMQSLFNGSPRKAEPIDVECTSSAGSVKKLQGSMASDKESDEPKVANARSFGGVLESEGSLEDDEVPRDAPVNRSALRAAFAASNKAGHR